CIRAKAEHQRRRPLFVIGATVANAFFPPIAKTDSFLTSLCSHTQRNAHALTRARSVITLHRARGVVRWKALSLATRKGRTEHDSAVDQNQYPIRLERRKNVNTVIVFPRERKADRFDCRMPRHRSIR